MSAPVTTVLPQPPLVGGAGHRPVRSPVVRLTWMLARPGAQSPATIVLPAVAFAVTTALVLTVLGGTLMFWRWTDEIAVVYQALSVLALALLLVPLASLGGAAARLSARRRDDRLATLRLLGATPGTVTSMTVLESAAVAFLGSIAGVLVYLGMVPLVGLIPFGGAPIGVAGVWVGVPLALVVVLGVTLLAAVSAAVGLRAVNVSPLGVRTKQQAPTVHWLRVLVGAGVVVVAYGALSMLTGLHDVALALVLLGLSFAAGVGVLGLIGPWVVGLVGRGSAKRAKTTDRLLAARSILESPKAAWRQVSGVAMTSFVAVVAGTGVALLDVAAGVDLDRESAVLIDDIRTGVIITLVASFLMVACSVGVNQAAAILDRRELYVSLDRLGVPREVMERARRRAVMLPLRVVSLGSAALGVLLVLPLAGVSLVLAPLSLLVIVGCFAAGLALVWLALAATRVVLTSVLRSPERA